MGGNVLKKLRSSKGASLTFALLAFLICAAVSAVLLAAGMAASGRLSKLTESDRRYYAVTSAAQLFCDSLKGQEFTIIRTQETETDPGVKYYKTEAGDISGGAVEATYFRTADPKNEIILPPEVLADESFLNKPMRRSAITNPSFLTAAALQYVYQGSDAEWVDTEPTKASYSWPPMELTVQPITAAVNAPKYLTVTVDAKMEADGTIVLTFKNKEEDPFTVQVTMSANIQDNSLEPIVNTKYQTLYEAVAGEDNAYIVRTVTTTTTTKTTIIKWDVADVKKVAE